MATKPKDPAQTKANIEKFAQEIEKIQKKARAAGVTIEAKVEEVTKGAPTLYDPKYCQMLIEHMSQGMSFRSFAGEIRVTFKTVYNWTEAHPDFLHARDVGEELCLSYWEKIGNTGAAGHLPGFNAAAYKYNMANRFKWTDRNDLTSGGQSIPPAQVIIQLPANGREAKK